MFKGATWPQEPPLPCLDPPLSLSTLFTGVSTHKQRNTKKIGQKKKWLRISYDNESAVLSASLYFDSEPAICEWSAFESIGRQCCYGCSAEITSLTSAKLNTYILVL